MPVPDFSVIKETLQYLDDWEDKYKAIIDFGKLLPPYPEDKRNESYKVSGCASQVWLNLEWIHEDKLTKLKMIGDSDAFIVKGLVCILCSYYNGTTPEMIYTKNILLEFDTLGLSAHISKQRANGFYSMVEVVKNFTNNQNKKIVSQT